ncbi:uncharacterized protein KIAA1143 homolog [Eurosta solidaginis]|uniref:uncharacterized protein KIAA1143 homolog n=1 Tax=Eurosta solidaginis TaxID=178769 RepID=UPI003530641E
MSGKRNISYVKPQDPSFLAKLKAQIGYREGPTVETKRQKLDYNDSGSDSEERPEREEEKPQVVVLRSGDLTAEEALKEEQRIAKGAEEVRADLSKPVVFKKSTKIQRNLTASTSTNFVSPISSSKNLHTSNNKDSATKKVEKQGSKSNRSLKEKSKLSFNIDEEYEDNV